MNAIPLIRASVLRPYLDVLGMLGAPCVDLLACVHLPPPEELRPEVLISYQQTLDFVAVCNGVTGGQQFPALMAQRTSLDQLGSWGRLLGRAKTLGELLRVTVETSWLHTNAVRWWLEDCGPEVRLCHHFDRRLDLGKGDVLVPLLGYILRGLRHVLGADFTPKEITLAVPLPVPTEQLGIDTPMRVSGITAIPVPRHLLSTPTPSVTGILTNAAPEGMSTLAQNAPARDLVGSLRQALLPLVCAGDTGIETVAEILRLSVRTLQRRLTEAGLSYRDLVQQVQLARALQLMADPSLKLIDVAFALGFSEHAHFTRAFRRWTGVSPRTFREIHLAPDRAALPRTEGHAL